MRIPVDKIMSGADAKLVGRERHAVPAQRLEVAVKNPLILPRMEAEIAQNPAGLPMADRQSIDAKGVLAVHAKKIIYYLQ
jgi:hypothetical protein